MEIIFLGTSAGVPTRARNVTAIALRKRNAKDWYLVDCGEGTQQRVLRTPLSLNRLEAIAITHLHGDHCFGLPGLLSSASMAGRERELHIVGPKRVRTFIEAVQATSGLHLTFPLTFHDVENLGRLELPDFDLEAGALSHGVASYGYAFSERGIERRLDTSRLEAHGIARGPVWGRLYRGEDVWQEDGTRLESDDYLLPTRRARKVVIAGDNDTPRLLDPLCTGADVLVHEATYTRDIVARLGTDNGHSTAAAVASFAEEKGLPNLILTHFSPRYVYASDASPSIAEIEDEARAHYRGTLFLANDFDGFRLSREGELGAPQRMTGSRGRASSASLWALSLADFRDAAIWQGTPGCGSVAAVTAVNGLALLLKALQKGETQRDDPQREALAGEAQALIDTLVGHADEDARAFEAYLEARRDARRGGATAHEKRERQDSMKDAAERVNRVPLAMAKACLDGLALTLSSLPHCKTSLGSDALAGGLLLHAALSSVLLNVDADLAILDDGDEKREMARTRQCWQREADERLGRLREARVGQVE